MFQRFLKALTGQSHANAPSLKGFSNPEAMRAQLRPGLYLGSSSSPGLGSCRTGGVPDVPDGFSWPTGPDGPLVFMGQIDLEQAHALLPESPLPATGVLQFFAGFPEPENEFGAAYDFYPEREAYRVLHHPSKQGLKQATYPADLPEVYRFRPTHHNLVLEQTLPDDESWVWRDQPISREDQDALDDVNFNGNAGLHVLGWPHGIQGDPAFDWATQDLELSYPLDDERIQKAKQASAAYVSLFQFDMPYTNRFEVIGESKVFFGIHQDALAQCDFDRAVLILQGT